MESRRAQKLGLARLHPDRYHSKPVAFQVEMEETFKILANAPLR